MAEVKEMIYVTTFYNPSLFWFVREQDLSARKQQTRAINLLSNFQRAKNITKGQLALIMYGNTWVRAEIVLIFVLANFKKQVICWLYDYGVFTIAYDIFELPEELVYYPCYLKKAILYGAMPQVNELNPTKGNMNMERYYSWSPNVRNNINKLISGKGKPQMYMRHCTFNEYEVGDVFHVDENGKEQSFLDLVIGWGLGVYDEDEFQKKIFSEQFATTQVSIQKVYEVRTSSQINYKDCHTSRVQHDPARSN